MAPRVGIQAPRPFGRRAFLMSQFNSADVSPGMNRAPKSSVIANLVGAWRSEGDCFVASLRGGSSQ